jgi:putative ABC transport system substrate-binding protein
MLTRDSVTRRFFLRGAGVAGLGLLASCGRLPWQAPPRIPRIGVLSSAADPADPTNEALRQGLRELGYVEGQNLIVEWRYSAGSVEGLSEAAAELVRLPVDLIVGQGTATNRAAKDATSTIPIVMTSSGDPVKAGLVASLARPGGNVTGLASLSDLLVGKCLELLKEAVPSLARVAMLWTPTIAGGADEFAESEVAARTLGIALQSAEVLDDGDLEVALEAIIHGRAEAIFLQGSLVTRRSRARIAAFAVEHRLPAVGIRREFVAVGSLMSYGPDYAQMHHRAAYYVDRILKGAKPADLPIEQPMRFEFVLNLKTAQALGLTLPQHVLAQATEVLQ